MPKVFVYDSFENRMMTYNLNESDSMPFSTGTTLRVREFRGSSSSPTLWRRDRDRRSSWCRKH